MKWIMHLFAVKVAAHGYVHKMWRGLTFCEQMLSGRECDDYAIQIAANIS